MGHLDLDGSLEEASADEAPDASYSLKNCRVSILILIFPFSSVVTLSISFHIIPCILFLCIRVMYLMYLS